MGTAWSGIWIVALLAFALAHFNNQRTRQFSLAALIVSPIITVTIGLAFVPPTPPSYLAEWPRAMWLALPVLAVWMALSIIGFFVGRWSVR